MPAAVTPGGVRVELDVQMLGGFGLYIDGEVVPAIPSRSATTLFAYLILNRDRAQTRDLLVGRFWPDQAEDRARRRLSNALWQIRAACKEVSHIDPIVASGGTLRIDPNLHCTVDVEEFESLVPAVDSTDASNDRSERDRLRALVGRYRGDFLAGYYDEWIDDYRDRAQSRYFLALRQLVSAYRTVAEYSEALGFARLLVSAAPLDEEANRDVIRLHALNGDLEAAEDQFEQCRRVLWRELRSEPSAETLELIGRVRRDAAADMARPSEPGAPPALLGREVERAALLGRVNELMGGKGGIVLVEGEAGVGKSTLIDEITRGAEWRNVQVLSGRHHPMSALRPYDALQAAMAPATTGLRAERITTVVAPVWLTHASTVLPGLRPYVDGGGSGALKPAEEPWRTAEALAQIILAQASPRPTLLILEDIHWSDDDTISLLIQLSERLLDSGVLVFLTYQRLEAERRRTVWAALTDLEARQGSSRVVVRPLEPSDVRQLAMAELGPGRVTQSGVEQLHALTGGNPHLVLEVLRSSQGRLDDALDHLSGPTPALSDALAERMREILDHRLMDADPLVEPVLAAVAVIGTVTTSDVVAEVADISRAEAIAGLSDAVELGFLAEQQGGCAFVQERTRQGVYDRISDDRRRELHGRVLDADLAVETGDRAHLADHAWRAERWAEAARHHTAAGRTAAAIHAYRTAAEHDAKADEAAGSAGVADAERIDQLLAAERVLDVLGRRAEQQQLIDRLRQVADGASDAVWLETVERSAWLLAQTDQTEAAVQLASTAVERAQQLGLDSGELLSVVGHAKAWSGDLVGAIGPLRDAVAEHERHATSSLAAELMLGRSLTDLHRPEEARHHLERAYGQAKEADNARSQVDALGHLAMSHYAEGDHVRVEANFLEAVRLAREIGYRQGEGTNLVNLIAIYVSQGQAGMALALVDEALDVFLSLGNNRGKAFVLANWADLLHEALGLDDLAAEKAEQAAIFFRSVDDAWRETACLTTLASIDFRRGRRRFAHRRLKAALERAVSIGDPYRIADVRLLLARVELALGEPEWALEQLAMIAEIDDRSAIEILWPAASAIMAKAHLALGSNAAALRAVDEAVAGVTQPGIRWPHLVAWWSSEVLRELGHEERAADQVTIAHRSLSRTLAGVPAAEAAHAWRLVPEYRAIAAAHSRQVTDQTERLLPRADAPLGRRLNAVDMVPVKWTLSDPDDFIWADPGSRRRQQIRRLVAEATEQGAIPRVIDLAEGLNVSERTIRRDLAQLRAEGFDPTLRGQV
ncbi:MAG: AAA family ATPase [Actinomycetota bacterium]